MRRAPAGLDLTVYGAAVVKLVRTPTVIVVPLLVTVVAVLVGHLVAGAGAGGLGSLTAGLAQFVVFLLGLWGLGSACILADDAWRRPRPSFETAWAETQRRGGEILTASVGVALLLSVAQYAGTISGTLGLILVALAFYFLIWAVPAAAIGGIPGGAAIQVSIDRVRSAPLAAAIATVVSLAIIFLVMPRVADAIVVALLPVLGAGAGIADELIGAFFEAIGIGYAALVLAKTYADVSFTRRW